MTAATYSHSTCGASEETVRVEELRMYGAGLEMPEKAVRQQVWIFVHSANQSIENVQMYEPGTLSRIVSMVARHANGLHLVALFKTLCRVK